MCLARVGARIGNERSCECIDVTAKGAQTQGRSLTLLTGVRLKL